jgi:septum formation protein
MKLILGSSSKYRKEVLEKHGYEFETMSPDVDELAIRSRDYHELPLLLAQAKARAVAAKISESALVIGVDIVVICDGELYEKPQSHDEVRAWLKKYGEGYPVETVCGIWLINTETGKEVGEVDVCRLVFSPVPEHAVEEFIKYGEPLTRGGGFSIQLPYLKPYINTFQGTIESIVGMPVHLLEELLAKVK